MFTYILVLAASAFAADYISYKPNPTVYDKSLKNGFTFTPSKAGIVYFDAPLGLKLSQCAVSIKESDVGKPYTVAVGGVPIFDGTPSANAVIKSVYYEKDSCAAHRYSVGINRYISKATVCKSTGDPHYLSSYGKSFSFQDEGFFTLFNSNHFTIQVFQKKHGKVSYNQAAAIRYGNEVYILDVRSLYSKVALTRAYGNQKYVIYAAPSSKDQTHKFTFSPCSSTITIKVNTGKIGRYLNIIINSAASYSENGISGICGAKTAPYSLAPFAIPASHNYFLNQYATLTPLSHADYKGLVSCALPKTNNACNPPATLPPSTISLPTYVAPSKNELSQVKSPSTLPQMVPPNYKQTVHNLCTKILSTIKCDDLVDPKFYIDSCKSDCELTGSLSEVESTKNQMIIDCKSRTELRKYHPDLNKAQAADAIQKSIGISNNSCPSNCSNKGECVSTGCNCNPGFTGLGCETNVTAIAAPASEFYPPIIYPSYAPVYGQSQILGQVPPPTAN